MREPESRKTAKAVQEPNKRRKAASQEHVTRRKILDAASDLFRDKGYASTTLRQIADAAGMQAGSVYYHFESKDAIVSEILDLGITYVFDEVKRRVEKLGPGAEPKARLEVAIDGHLSGLLSHESFLSANIRNYGQLPEDLRKKNVPLRRAYVGYWDALLLEAQKAGAIRADLDLKILRLFTIGSLNWTVEWHKPDKGSIEELSMQIKSILFDGISPVG